MRSDRQAFNDPPVFAFSTQIQSPQLKNYVQNVESKIRPVPEFFSRDGPFLFRANRAARV